MVIFGCATEQSASFVPPFDAGNLDGAPPRIITGGVGGGTGRRDAGGPEVDAGEVDECLGDARLLFVFDRSGSMLEAYADSTKSRLQAATEALEAALEEAPDALAIGALFFPTDENLEDPSCPHVAPFSEPGAHVGYRTPSAFVSAWDEYWMRNGPAGGTPLFRGLQRADEILNPSVPTLVVVVTDGEPTCTNDDELGMVSRWADAGIRTHVIGVPGFGYVPLLEDLAFFGDGELYEPGDVDALDALMAELVEEAAEPACQ